MKYYTFNEFINSDKANELNIDNTPEQWQLENVKEFVNNLLDPLREDWEKYCNIFDLGNPALIITSGVRCKELNDNISGASKTSAHYLGYAADIVPANRNLKEFKIFCIKWLKNKNFDQMISENENNNIPEWIHIGYKNNAHSQRKQFLLMNNNNYYYIKMEDF